MMQAVDADLVLAGCPTQLRRWIDLDRVRQVAAPERAHLVTLEMLDQRAAHRHVDHLLAAADAQQVINVAMGGSDRKSTRLNSSHQIISYAVFCLKKKKT